MTPADPQDDGDTTAGPPNAKGQLVERRAGDAVDELAAIRRLLFGILVLLTIVALFFARELLLPIMLGVLLTLTLSPIVRAVARWGVPAPLSAAVLIGGLGLSVFSGAYLMSDTVSAWVDDAPSVQRQLEQRLGEISKSFEKVREASEKIESLGESGGEEEGDDGAVEPPAAASIPGERGAAADTDGAQEGSEETKSPEKVVVQDRSYLEMAVSNLTSAGSSLLAAIILAFFLLASGDLFYVKLISSFDRLHDKKTALRVVYDIERRISRYLFTVTVINVGLGLAIGVAMHLIGMPYPYIWGAVAFGLNYLPYVGIVIGTALVAVFSLVTFDYTLYALLAPAAYLGLGAIEGNVITPTVVGRRLEINTVSVLLAVVFWAWLWGVAGALMAVPILVLVKVVCDNVERFSSFSNFLAPREVQPAVWEQEARDRRAASKAEARAKDA